VITLIKPCVLQFTTDGTSTAFIADLAALPLGLVFTGVTVQNVLIPSISPATVVNAALVTVTKRS
jgi:hypothetical protein